MKEKQKYYDDLEKRFADYEKKDIMEVAVSGNQNISVKVFSRTVSVFLFLLTGS